MFKAGEKMSKISEIFNYMRSCPKLSDLWSIAATEDMGVKVILPLGASPAVEYREHIDVTDFYECDVIPYPSVYEDYQINCFQAFDASDSNAPDYNVNILNFDEVQSICDWIAEQNENNNLPVITGKKVVSIECNPFIPQIRYVNVQENIIAYFITVRIRYVNTAKRRSVAYEFTD